MILIGLSGKIGCGKTSVARMIQTSFKYPKIIGFGTLVKDKCAEYFGFNRMLANTENGKNSTWVVERDVVITSTIQLPAGTYTIRKLLQWFATEWHRTLDPDCWVKAMQEYIELHERDHDVILVDDVRFVNEATFLRVRNGYMVRINPYPEYDFSKEHCKHRSETELDTYLYWDLVFKPAFGLYELNHIARSVLTYVNLLPKSLTSISFPDPTKLVGLTCR